MRPLQAPHPTGGSQGAMMWTFLHAYQGGGERERERERETERQRQRQRGRERYIHKLEAELSDRKTDIVSSEE